ncbi:LysR family transcriptional regulator [Paenibacillus sp. MMS18-CY102]|uniref:LysR family transcriptional regulator n=1 Tax=Paenibacillus sp. MMS18-CY102 TaxID=2682849 RepID=UPI001365D464|nr:LysR family transcriptional regulator [Paenibacillus sp. MMS18-CY102]MWC27853.1 LysR family transcriptional regulator [Paenibacillus sp. MMS18-CY102]
MDIRHLTYFIAVAQHRSFTVASRHLNVTQPTLSKMVRLLEEELGATLLDRSGKTIRLTDAGETILRSAQQVTKAMDDMAAQLDDLIELKSGTIRIGIPPMIGGRFFPSAIEQFSTRYPNVQLHLVEQGGRRNELDIDSGDLDIGIVLLPVEGAARFHLHPLLEEKLMLLVHLGHPLANRTNLKLSELRDEPFVLFREDFTLRHLVVEHCRTEGFEPRVVFESSQWDFMTEMVAAKLGITLLPESVCRSLDQSRFSAIELDEPRMVWQLAMVWSKERYLSYAARTWIRFIQEELGKLPVIAAPPTL